MKTLTLTEMSNSKPELAKLNESILVIVDAQREYLEGSLPLWNFTQSVDQGAKILDAARSAGAPVIHVVHHGKTGSPIFDPETSHVEIVRPLTPRKGEPLLIKNFPNAFAQTELAKLIRVREKHLIIIGYMTHMCVSATVRAGFDLGYSMTVVADACSTRDLSGYDGKLIAAEQVHLSTLAALRDRFANVVSTETILSS